MAADETNHRDVNHTFAGMHGDDPNPYVTKHNQVTVLVLVARAPRVARYMAVKRMEVVKVGRRPARL